MGTEQQQAVPAVHTAGEGKERMSEVLFALAVFFGLLHFVSIAGQVGVMFAHTALNTTISFPIKSSMILGHIYIGFLAGYVGRKQFVRSFSNDAQVLPNYVWLKFTRGEMFIIGWGVFTGLVVLLWQMSYINEIPETLLWTLGEVVAIWIGSDAAKYFTAKSAAAKQDNRNESDFGDRVVDYAKAHNGIDNSECQAEFGLGDDQAYRLLKRLEKAGKLKPHGTTKDRRYFPA